MEYTNLIEAMAVASKKAYCDAEKIGARGFAVETKSGTTVCKAGTFGVKQEFPNGENSEDINWVEYAQKWDSRFGIVSWHAENGGRLEGPFVITSYY